MLLKQKFNYLENVKFKSWILKYYMKDEIFSFGDISDFIPKNMAAGSYHMQFENNTIFKTFRIAPLDRYPELREQGLAVIVDSRGCYYAVPQNALISAEKI